MKIGFPCRSLWHNYPMNTKHRWQKRGQGWKLPLQKCSLGVVTLTLYRRCVSLSADEQGKGHTNGQHTDPVKRQTNSTLVQWKHIHIHTYILTYMHAHVTIPTASCWVLCGHAQKLLLTGVTLLSLVHMVMMGTRTQMGEMDFLFFVFRLLEDVNEIPFDYQSDYYKVYTKDTSVILEINKAEMQECVNCLLWK